MYRGSERVCQKAGEVRSDRSAGRRDAFPWSPGAPSFGQRPGVRCEGSEAVAGGAGHGGTLYIEPGSPWENGYCESFNGKLRDECLNGEIFYSLREARIVIEQWRKFYNTERPHSALGYRPPAPASWIVAA